MAVLCTVKRKCDLRAIGAHRGSTRQTFPTTLYHYCCTRKTALHFDKNRPLSISNCCCRRTLRSVSIQKWQ
jgi:hypothetical protein